MSALPAPRTGIHDRVAAENCYGDRDFSAAIAIEIVSDYLERCWFGPGPRDFYARFTADYHADQLAALSHSTRSATLLSDFPIGSRFD